MITKPWYHNRVLISTWNICYKICYVGIFLHFVSTCVSNCVKLHFLLYCKSCGLGFRQMSANLFYYMCMCFSIRFATAFPVQFGKPSTIDFYL